MNADNANYPAVYIAPDLVQLAPRENETQGYWKDRWNKVIEVVFTQTVGASEANWIPEIVHEEALVERPVVLRDGDRLLILRWDEAQAKTVE